MADDWDLYAVVRSCKSATHTTTTNTSAAAAPTNPITPPSAEEEDPFWDWLKSEEETDPLFSFPNLLEPRANAFQELQQFYEPLLPNPTTTNNPSTNNNTFVPPIIPNSPIISDFGGSASSGQHHLQQQQHHFLPTNTPASPPFNPAIFPPGFGEFHGQQQPLLLPKPETQILPQQLPTQQGFMRPRAMVPALPPPLPRVPFTMPINSPRPRKRKCQQKRQVCQVSAENLSADLWAWRKYGQKPIKGSPHPRNYYRCSSSKGCSARKQVERSTADPNIFVVTYTGDHNHPRPTHRNSLAGSTRNKLSATAGQNQPINNDPGSPPAQADQDAVANNVNSDNSFDKENEELDEEEERDENEIEDEDVEEDDVLIPNTAMPDEIFLGLKQLGCTSSSGSGGSLAAGASGDTFSDQEPSSLGSSWAAAGATVGGGC
ncbi:unnamed protein product [Prunus brigantina]